MRILNSISNLRNLCGLIATAALAASCVTTNSEFDADGDGKVEVNELEAAFTREMYDMADTNKDGKVSKDEADTAAKNDPEWKFAEADTDNDGYLSYEELVVVVDEENVFDDYLKRIDTNGDGVISNSESRNVANPSDALEREQNLTPLERMFESEE